MAAAECYPGGKGVAGLWQWIISRLPTHAYYAEPFAGHGSILRRKPPALRSHVVDSDPDVVAWWRRLNLPAVEVLHGCGVSWMDRQIRRGVLGPEWVLYCDPPYPLVTRTKKRLYRQELTDRDHRRLLDACRAAAAAGACVLVSSYPNAIYAAALADWQRDEREVITRGGVLRTEVLWSNVTARPSSTSLAVEYSQLGGDYRARERVARRIRRWVSRMKAMPPAERRATLLALLEIEGS